MARRKDRPRRPAATRRPPPVPVNDSDPTSAAGSRLAGQAATGNGERPPDLVREVTASLLSEIADARHALEAELVLCAAFEAVDSGSPADADEQRRLEALTIMLGEVIGDAERLASVESLALLRVCSVLGPQASRNAAQENASRLAAAGVPDRPWAGIVGRPALLRAWRYGDVFGQQSSVGLLFDYRGREHAVTVLIDHALGGGVKDCWAAGGRRVKDLRFTVAASLAAAPDAFFEDIGAAAAADHLETALRCPPCPEQADQVKDVSRYLYLLRARTEHLARLAGTPSIHSG